METAIDPLVRRNDGDVLRVCAACERNLQSSPGMIENQITQALPCTGTPAAIIAARDQRMYARRLYIDVLIGGKRQPCPLEWLDQFAMRNFTGAAEFDDTLPVAEGLLEAGLRVEPPRLARSLADWLTRRGKGDGQAVEVEIREEPREKSSC